MESPGAWTSSVPLSQEGELGASVLDKSVLEGSTFTRRAGVAK